MSSKPLDPNLASILDSIRATVGGETPPPPVEVADPAEDLVEAASVKAAAPAPRPVAKKAMPAAQQSVEEFLAELIRPQVSAWLSAHLPEIVQKMAADEIARLTGKK
jgi:cell pole-organizing protein PopZ